MTAKHFPLSCSLLAPVMERYGEPQAQGQAMAMEIDELLGYLRNNWDLALTPLQSVMVQTESIGDPAVPGVEQAAILQWLGDAFDNWEQHYPLESPLRQDLRRLKPLAACLAVTDPKFMVPGAHPLHRILDSLQLAAVGWQASLGRAGQALQQQITKTVDDALGWLEDTETDLEAACCRVVEAVERDQARASRMAQRMVEAEQGRAKTTEVRRIAAELINAALEEFHSPAIIGEFLKGPWYDSAQLVLLKFTEESPQWQQMSATTRTLLDSVQFTGSDADLKVEGDAERRQRLFELVSQLPRELKRWLLSVQHDADAMEQAIGMVEYAHMQILRKQPLTLEKIELIAVPGSGTVEAGKHELASIENGQWFCVDLGGDEPKRVKLVMRKDDAGELLFANLAGIKVLQSDFEEFAQLLNNGKVKTLDSGASFSLSMLRSAGIDDTDQLGGAVETVHEDAVAIERETAEVPAIKAMPADQRKHLRLPVRSTAFIETVSAGIGGADSGKVAVCNTLDISRGGLKVSLEHELVVGAVLQIRVELPDLQETLHLTGEVRWCLQNLEEENSWSAGFALLKAGASDIDRWIALLAGLEN